MWERIKVNLPPDVAFATTSVWQYPEIMLIGVMRKNFLSPPILWAQVLKAGMRNLRKAPTLVTELQRLIESPTVYAEAELQAPRNQALLTYLGFKELPEEYDRKLYSRSI
jgi:hypothetical protein